MTDEPQSAPADRDDTDEIVSLDELSRAFAHAMARPRGAESPAAPPSSPFDPAAEAPPPEVPGALPAELPDIGSPDEDDDPCRLSPQTILEAMLFVGNRRNDPLTPAHAAELMRGVAPGEIPDLVDTLNAQYAAEGCPYRIVGEGSGYRLALGKRFSALRDKFYGRASEARLSQAAIDILAIVAYRQPLTADEIGTLRGAPSGHILRQLVRRQLLRIDRPEGRKQPARYHTTQRFLDIYGLASLNDLPRAEELENR